MYIKSYIDLIKKKETKSNKNQRVGKKIEFKMILYFANIVLTFNIAH